MCSWSKMPIIMKQKSKWCERSFTHSFIHLSLVWYWSLRGSTWIDVVIDKVCHSGLFWATMSWAVHIFVFISQFFWGPWCRPPSKAPGKTVSCQVTWPNQTSLHYLTVMIGGFWCPSSVASSLYDIQSSLLRHLVLDALNLLTILANRTWFTFLKQDWYYAGFWQIILHSKPYSVAAPDHVQLSHCFCCDSGVDICHGAAVFGGYLRFYLLRLSMLM